MLRRPDLWRNRAFVLLGLLAGLPAIAGPLSIRRLRVPDGIPAHLCSALAQDRDGFLWIGTESGLVRFDGNEFHVFRSDPADPSSIGGSYVRALLAARDGRLWAGTFSDGLSVYDPETERFTRYRKGLAHPRVEGLAEDARGRIWISTNEGLDRLDPVTGHIEHFRHVEGDLRSLADDRVRGLLVDRSGTLWVGSRGGLQHRKDESSGFVPVASSPRDPGSLHGQLISRLFEDDRGRIWIGTTEHGAAVLDPASGTLTRILPRPLRPDGLSHFWVYGFAQVTPQEIWVATFGGGVDVIESASLRVTRRLRHDPFLESSLGGDRIGAILADRTGVVWIGTWGQGLARHDPASRAFENLRHSPNQADGLSVTGAVRALEMSDGNVWVGTDGNGVDILDPSWTRVGSHRPDPANPAALSAGSVTCLAQGTDGSIWVATLDGALHLWAPGARGFRRFTPADGLPGGPIRTLAFGREGALWAGAAEGMARLTVRTARIDTFRHHPDDPSSLSGHAVEAIAVRPDGRLWVGTDGGLDLFDPESGTAVRMTAGASGSDNLPSKWIPDLLVSRSGDLWIATQAGAYVLRSEDGTRARFSSVARLLNRSSSVASLIEDSQGKIWLGPTLRVDPETWSFDEFGPAEGVEFRSFFFASRSRTRAGSLLFGSGEGLLVVHPDRIGSRPAAPPLVATAIFAGGVPLPGATRRREVVLAAGKSTFRIDFAGLEFTSAERISYRHMLEGLESDWTVSAASRRSATYTNLSPGKYLLRAQVSNRSGAFTSSELRIPVLVEPAFHQTVLFRLVLLLVGAGLAFGGYRFRIRQLEARERQLVGLVAERTEELRVANSELARQNELLSHHMRLQEDMERMSRHDLRTPLAGILSVVGMLRKAPGLGPRGHTLVDLIERGTYRVLDMVNLSLDFVRMEKGTYRLRARPVDVAFLVRHVCDDLAEHAASKRVRFAVHQDAPLGTHAWGEEVLSYSMLANLLKNAMEASPEGAEVRIRILQTDEKVMIEIHNEGAVPSALRERFFEKYRSVGKEGGTGLGTYSARLLAETQNGSISMRTSELSGTDITVTLERAVVAASELTGGPEKGAGKASPRVISLSDITTLPPLRVLVVDDDPFNAAVLTASLPVPPLRIEIAVNGLMALEKAETFQPEVIFLDLEMPVMGGLEAVRRMREREADVPLARRAWVAGLSAHDDPKTKEAFLAAGCDRYLVKPAEPEEIRAVLVEVARREAGPAAPLLDSAGGVRRAGGNQGLHRRLLGRFLDDVLGLVRDLESPGGGPESRERLLMRLHTVKGTAATLGAMGISSEAGALEAAIERAPGAPLQAAGFSSAVLRTRELVLEAEQAETPEPRVELPEAEFSPESRAEALALARNLSSLLAQSDLSAADCLERLTRVLGRREAVHTGKLQECLDRLDFEAAALPLAQITENLSPSGRT